MGSVPLSINRYRDSEMEEKHPSLWLACRVVLYLLMTEGNQSLWTQLVWRQQHSGWVSYLRFSSMPFRCQSFSLVLFKVWPCDCHLSVSPETLVKKQIPGPDLKPAALKSLPEKQSIFNDSIYKLISERPFEETAGFNFFRVWLFKALYLMTPDTEGWKSGFSSAMRLTLKGVQHSEKTGPGGLNLVNTDNLKILLC